MTFRLINAIVSTDASIRTSAYKEGALLTKLEKILKEKEIKQTWLAKKINKSPEVLNRWVKGRRTPTYKNMLKISKALDIPVDEIFPSDDVNN